MRDDIVFMDIEAEENWTAYKHNFTDPFIVDSNSLSDFYLFIAHNYALDVGYSPGTAYRLSVFEILQGETHKYSPEFILFNEVVTSELLYHYAVFLMSTNPEKLIGIYHTDIDATPLSLGFDMSNKILYQKWQTDPVFVENFILTRTLSSYRKYCHLISEAYESLQRIPDDKVFYETNHWDTSIFNNMEETLRENLSRYEFIVNLIEILVDNGAKPYTPQECQKEVHSYLNQLVKNNDAYLNPFVENEEKKQMMKGELKIQAHMESQTGNDWILPS